MNSPKLQKQHRISRVYLKQFGYKKNGVWFISAWQKAKDYTDNFPIDRFTVEANIFDLPFEDETIKRHFENMSQKIESQYNKILNTIKNQRRLTPRHQVWLCHYIANFICRSQPSRDYFQFLLDHEVARNYFLEEITMFEPDLLDELQISFPLIPSEFRLNLAIGNIMNYLVRVLRNFSYVVLEADPKKGWFTSDNPVLIDAQEEISNSSEYLYVIPIESEIYFPLSRVYCLFAFHKDSEKKSNPLRSCTLNSIHKIDDATHDKICKKIGTNSHEFFILNTETAKSFLKTPS
jgi:hypothetical protein